MSLTVSDAWRKTVQRDGARIRVLVSIFNGTDTWKAVSGSMDWSTDLAGTPVAVTKVTPLGVELDPFTRAVEIEQIFVDVADRWIRPIIVNNRLKGQQLSIRLGAAELDESDFVSFSSNTMIENLIPTDEHTIRIATVGQLKLVLDAPIDNSNYWINKHLLECLYDGAGGGILEVAGGHSFKATSFLRTDPAYYDINHVIVSRASVGRGNPATGTFQRYGASGITTAVTGRSLATEIMQLINGYLVENEEGQLAVARFDPTAAAVDHWTARDIVPGSFKQESLGDNVINEIVYDYQQVGTGGSGVALASQYIARDSDSQARYAYPGSSVRKIASTFSTRWVGTWQRLYTAISDVATSLILAGPACYAVAGNRSDMTIDGDHPVYLLINSAFEGGGHAEIVKAEALTRSTNFIGNVYVFDGDDQWEEEGPFSAHLAFSSVSRAQRGTTAFAHPRGTPVQDITALVLLCDRLLDRFSDGCPIIELAVPLVKFFVQIGDLVTLDWPAYVDYGLDGVDDAIKWEVITKEVDVFSDPPKMRVRLAYAGESTGTKQAAVYGWRARWMDDRDVARSKDATQFALGSGIDVSTDTGLTGTIAAGYATNGARRIWLLENVSHTFTATRDTYVYLDLDSQNFGALLFKEVAVSDPDPGTEDNELFLAKVTTNASAITAIDDDAVETRTIPGSNLKAGTGPLAKMSQGGLLDFSAAHPNKTLDYIGDGTSYARMAAAAVDGSGLLDFSVAHTNKTLDHIGDGSTYRRVVGIDGSNRATAASLANGAVTTEKVASIDGSKLNAGTGPLTQLSQAGALNFAAAHTNKTLDNIGDGTTYKRLVGVDGSNRATSSSLAAAAVTTAKVAAYAIGTHQTAADSFGRNHNFDFGMWTR